MTDNLLKLKIITIFSFIFLYSCNQETIVYSEIENPDGTIGSFTLPLSENKVFQDLPSLGSSPRLYFGSVKESDNLFSLIEMTLFSGNLPPIGLSDMLADSVQIDSALVFFQTADTLNSASDLSLYSIVSSEGDVFSSDSTNFYNLNQYIDYESNSLFLSSISLSDIAPDSTGFDTLKFMFKENDLSNLKTYFFDTENYPARTFMLKADENLDESFTVQSHDSGNSPKMKVWYKIFEDEEVVTDTFATFFSTKDISLFNPPSIENNEKSLITLNSASGLKSILKYNLSNVDELSRNKLIIDANIMLDVENSNLNDNDNFYVIVSTLQDSVSNWNYSSFFDSESQEDYSINSNFLVSSKIENNKLVIPIRTFLQAYKNGLFENRELILYSSASNSPFDKVSLNFNSIEVTYVEP
tara:strand:- start:1281 stop:2519 length:1239 start_codon:yes stop_codon:yes gene_type:complete